MTQLSKNNGDVNTPTYAIYGENRRILMKKRNQLRSFIRNYWHMVGVDNDLYSIYGQKDKVKSKEDMQKEIDKMRDELVDIELKLEELYKGEK